MFRSIYSPICSFANIALYDKYKRSVYWRTTSTTQVHNSVHARNRITSRLLFFQRHDAYFSAQKTNHTMRYDIFTSRQKPYRKYIWGWSQEKHSRSGVRVSILHVSCNTISVCLIRPKQSCTPYTKSPAYWLVLWCEFSVWALTQTNLKKEAHTPRSWNSIRYKDYISKLF